MSPVRGIANKTITEIRRQCQVTQAKTLVGDSHPTAEHNAAESKTLVTKRPQGTN